MRSQGIMPVPENMFSYIGNKKTCCNNLIAAG
jgi:hypothetical protein